MKKNRISLALFTGMILMAFTSAVHAQNGMPMDETTGKVAYKGILEVANTPKTELAEKLALYLSSYTQFRGTFSGIYITDDKSKLSCVLTMSATPFAKQVKCIVNAAVTIDIEENKLTYEITNLYTYGIHFINFSDDEDYGDPIEKSDNFNVYDFNAKNDNAKTAHTIIISFLDNLTTEFK